MAAGACLMTNEKDARSADAPSFPISAPSAQCHDKLFEFIEQGCDVVRLHLEFEFFS